MRKKTGHAFSHVSIQSIQNIQTNSVKLNNLISRVFWPGLFLKNLLVSFFFASESTTTARGSRKLKEGVILCNWWRDKIITNHFTNSRAKKIFCNFKYGKLAIIIPLDFYIITLLHLTIKKSSYVQILICPKMFSATN